MNEGREGPWDGGGGKVKSCINELSRPPGLRTMAVVWAICSRSGSEQIIERAQWTKFSRRTVLSGIYKNGTFENNLVNQGFL